MAKNCVQKFLLRGGEERINPDVIALSDTSMRKGDPLAYLNGIFCKFDSKVHP